jgi:hypothetical protein
MTVVRNDPTPGFCIETTVLDTWTFYYRHFFLSLSFFEHRRIQVYHKCENYECNYEFKRRVQFEVFEKLTNVVFPNLDHAYYNYCNNIAYIKNYAIHSHFTWHCHCMYFNKIVLLLCNQNRVIFSCTIYITTTETT